MNLVDRAAEYARVAHESIRQRRRLSNAPYIVHPKAVAETVAAVTDDEAMIAAAWLHDVVEDTPITIEEIEDEFGKEIAGLVADLTKVSLPSDGDRGFRKALDRQHISKAQARAKTIKLADLLDNLSDLEQADSSFALMYMREKEQQLEVLTEGDSRLYLEVQKVIQRLKSSLPTHG